LIKEEMRECKNAGMRKGGNAEMKKGRKK